MANWNSFLLDFVGDARLSKLLSSFLPGLLATGALFLIALTVEPGLWKGVDPPKPATKLEDSAEAEKTLAQKRELEARIQTINQKLNLEGNWLSAIDNGAGLGLKNFIQNQPHEKDKLKNLLVGLNGLRNESYSKLLGMSQELHRETARLAEIENKLAAKPKDRKPLLGLFYDYLIQFLLPGLILGVFIGQMARTLIVEKLFKDKKKESPVSLDYLLASGKMTQDNYANLVSRTYDYSAICASNAIGLFLFGVVWMYFGMNSDYSPGRILLPGLTCMVMTGVLFNAGKKSYAGFVKGKDIWAGVEKKHS